MDNSLVPNLSRTLLRSFPLLFGPVKLTPDQERYTHQLDIEPEAKYHELPLSNANRGVYAVTNDSLLTLESVRCASKRQPIHLAL